MFTTPPFTLRQLQYALAVAETGRFRLAAERCGVSQPALSAQLAELETALGARLFERGRSGVLTTKAGDVLLARMRAVLQASRDLSTTAEGLGNPLAGTRRFGILPTVAPYVLPDLSPALRAAFPGLRLSWREEKTATLLDAVLAGELDAALVAEDEAPRGLSLVPLARDPFVLALPPHHPLTKRKRVTLADLATTEMLLLEDGHCIRTQVLALCSRAGATEASFRATSLPTLTQLVAGGFGATLLPTLSLATENRRGELLLRSFTSPAPARTLALVYRAASGNHEGLAL